MLPEQLPERLKPFQRLMDELSDPENKPVVPPLDTAFQRQLRAQLLGQQTMGLSRQAVGQLWRFAATAVLLIILAIGIGNLWLALSRQPAPAAAPVARPMATPQTVPTPTRVREEGAQPLLEGEPTMIPAPAPTLAPFAEPLGWQTAVAFPLLVGDGLQIEAMAVENERFVMGETAVFTLTWNATAFPSANYTSFIHLYDSNGTLLAQSDTPLGATSEWQVPGQVSVPYTFGVPFSAPNLPYQLFAGLYDARTGQQLKEVGQGGMVLLAQIDLAANSVPNQAIADCVEGQPIRDTFGPPYPFSEAVANGVVWVGDDGLWTAVPSDYVWRDLARENGRYAQKLFWWSQQFDIATEPNPALSVVGRRLNGDAPPLVVQPATTGSSPDLGSFMLTGIEIPTPGCWEISGSYREHTVSYVVWVAGNE